LDNSSRELVPGTVLDGRYEILGKLGMGTFSSVYRARDLMLGAEYALKVLRNMDGADAEALTRFKREALLSQRVAHEDCCRVYDFVTANGLSILKMELVSGWTLAQLISKLRPVPLPVALSLSVQSAAAVGALHRQGVVHRDIKASNLMVTRQGRIKVMDLGVSWAPEMSSLTMAGTLLGTPSYMAPELILQQKATARSDVYALGALSYYLLCGRLPFSAPDLVKLFMMQVGEQPPRPRDVRPELSVEMEELLMRCLDKDAEKRPADAVALEDAWRGALRVEPDPDFVGGVLHDLESLLDADDPVVDLGTATLEAVERRTLEAATRGGPRLGAQETVPRVEARPQEAARPGEPSPAVEMSPAEPPAPSAAAVAGQPERGGGAPVSGLQPVHADESSLDTVRRGSLVRRLFLVLLALAVVAAVVVAGLKLRR
jgi:serine/threonine protein kinase